MSISQAKDVRAVTLLAAICSMPNDSDERRSTLSEDASVKYPG